MMEAPVQRRRMIDRLGFQLAFILAAVLLPLALISLSKSLALVNEVEARTQTALMGETMRAASTELQLIQEAHGAADVLAVPIAPLIEDDAACSRALSRLAAEHPQYLLIAYIPTSGLMRCSSSGVPFDFSDHQLFETMIDEQHSGLVVSRNGPISGVSVLGVSHPIYDAAGAYIGIISLLLPHEGLSQSEGAGDRAVDLDLYTFDSTGNVLTASTGFDDLTALPRDRSLAALAGPEPLAFTALSESGELRVFSVVPLVSGELFALGTRISESRANVWRTLASPPILIPVLMWLASLVVAWLAVERLVTRNVRKLSRSIKSFASGNRIIGDIDVAQAPMELRDMAQAYESMTESIIRNEAELENTIHEKEVLLREVHHRVKNNLQLIASIMNMQVRRVKSSEARQMLTELRDRVMNLATIHRELFETAGRVDVHADELLTSIVRQVADASPGLDRRFNARTDLEYIQMVPDQAVPLGLLVGEALTSAVRHGTDLDGKGVRIDIRLHRDGEERAVLEIANSSERAENAEALHSGLGTQLIAAFAMQLDGKVDRGQSGSTYYIKVVFPLRSLLEAEFRHQGQQVA